MHMHTHTHAHIHDVINRVVPREKRNEELWTAVFGLDSPHQQSIPHSHIDITHTYIFTYIEWESKKWTEVTLLVNLVTQKLC